MQYSLSSRGEKKIGHERKLGGVPIYPFYLPNILHAAGYIPIIYLIFLVFRVLP